MADQQSVSPLTESELRSLLSHISALRGVPMYEHLEALLAEQQGDRNAKHLQNIARAALSDEAAESQVAELREALAENREKWSFDVLLAVGDALLERDYPEVVFPNVPEETGDPGPRLVRALRACRAATDEAKPE